MFPTSKAAPDRQQFTEGKRVRAIWHVLDPGLRLWHDQADTTVVRVVRVSERDFTELFRGSQPECEARYPAAVWGINDNESVPPGTEGTVDHNDGTNLHIKWDNGRSLNVGPNDELELVS